MLTSILSFNQICCDVSGPPAQQILHQSVRVHGLHHGEGVLVQGRGSALRAGLEVQQQGDQKAHFSRVASEESSFLNIPSSRLLAATKFKSKILLVYNVSAVKCQNRTRDGWMGSAS